MTFALDSKPASKLKWMKVKVEKKLRFTVVQPTSHCRFVKKRADGKNVKYIGFKLSLIQNKLSLMPKKSHKALFCSNFLNFGVSKSLRDLTHLRLSFPMEHFSSDA